MNVNDLSLKTVITTGRMSPACFCVAALNSFAERHDVDAARSERGADWRRRVRLTSGDLNLNVGYDFFGHVLKVF
jgi:hypothetical protein